MATNNVTISTFVDQKFADEFAAYCKANNLRAANAARDAIAQAYGLNVKRFYDAQEKNKAERAAKREAEKQARIAKKIADEKAEAEKQARIAAVGEKLLAANVTPEMLESMLANFAASQQAEAQTAEVTNN